MPLCIRNPVRTIKQNSEGITVSKHSEIPSMMPCAAVLPFITRTIPIAAQQAAVTAEKNRFMKTPSFLFLLKVLKIPFTVIYERGEDFLTDTFLFRNI